MKKHPKLLRSLFNLTSDDDKVPTNIGLDEEIEKLGFLMHAVWPLLIKIIKIKIGLFLRYKWKTWAKYIMYFGFLITATLIAWFKVTKPIFIETPEKTVVNEIYFSSMRSFSEFVNIVGEHESGNNYDTINEFGMLGMFQFAPSTLKGIGIYVDPAYFLKDSLMQVSAFKLLLTINKATYQKYIDKWEGKTLPQDKNCVMTESGILMAFHLKPSDAVAYFESGCTEVGSGDGYGVKVYQVIRLYSGYKLDLISY